MGVVAVESTRGIGLAEFSELSTQDVDANESRLSYDGLIDRITEILGYDIFASEAEGYREMAEESLRLAESNLPAATETLPAE